MPWLDLSEDLAARAPEDPARRQALWSILGGGLEALLWVVAVVALGCATWMAVDSWLYQHWARLHLTTPAVAGAVAASPGSTTATSPLPAIPAGTPIAQLSMPRLDVSVVVAEGVSATVLRRAVGHVPQSARPGESGNVVLAGHRDTFLRALKDLHPGDLLVLEGAASRDVYRVERLFVVAPTEVGVMADPGYPALTIITCYPFHFVGRAPQRFVARARRVDGTPGAATAPAFDPVRHGG